MHYYYFFCCCLKTQKICSCRKVEDNVHCSETEPWPRLKNKKA
uniref:Uncharacterized protein n=1 Tax=Anguilla anguilla TaxID=7936 RepID=A0A0E9WU87_ANGAN